jgi:TldD protein
MGFSQSFFAGRFGITELNLEQYLSEALSAGGEYADLYFEYLSTCSISIDESIVKSATEGVTLGVGVRVIAGERTGYAYSDDLSPEKIRRAARVAACIAHGPASVLKTGFEETSGHNLYPMLRAPHEAGLDARVDLVKRADKSARAYDPRVFQVQVSYADSIRNVLIATRAKLAAPPNPAIRGAVDASPSTSSVRKSPPSTLPARPPGRPSFNLMRSRRRPAR